MSFLDDHISKFFGGETVARASEAISGLTSEQHAEVSEAVNECRHDIYSATAVLDGVVERHVPVVDTVAEVIPVPEPAAEAVAPEVPELPSNVTPLQLAEQQVQEALKEVA